MNSCAMGVHFITWATETQGPPPGIYNCYWCGVPIPIHEVIVEKSKEEPRLEEDQWKLYERMRQDYKLFHNDH